MILNCEFEELRALDRGAELVLEAYAARSPLLKLASQETLDQVENLRPLLNGSITVSDVSEIDSIQTAVRLISRTLKRMLHEKVIEFHPAHEEAVGLYFDYAHVLTVEHRVDRMAAEMHAIADLLNSSTTIGK
ncbi:hypothetical protein BH23GEM8_BH23GEM8_05430 [soil metagenome]